EHKEGDPGGAPAPSRSAIRCFLSQTKPAGRSALPRQDSADFLSTYAMLGNRTVHESHIGVSADTYALLRNAFSRRYLIQRAHFDMLGALRRDVALLDEMQQRHGNTATS